MGFYSCSLTRLERDRNARGEPIYVLYTYDVVLSKWARCEFSHTEAGLTEALNSLRGHITELSM